MLIVEITRSNLHVVCTVRTAVVYIASSPGPVVSKITLGHQLGLDRLYLGVSIAIVNCVVKHVFH